MRLSTIFLRANLSEICEIIYSNWYSKSETIRIKQGRTWPEVSKFQPWVIKVLKDSGVFVVRMSPGKGIPNGMPDLLAIYKGETALIELKVRSNSLRSIQESTIDNLYYRGASVFVITLCNDGKITFEKPVKSYIL